MTNCSRRRLAVVAAIACLVPAGGMAQEPRWEIEVYGGIVAARAATDGTRTPPPAGAPIVTSNPLFPSREVPSWFFGDGAALVNEVAEDFGAAARIAPLDPLFAPGSGGRSAAAGARLRRGLSSRTSLEFSLDWLGGAALAPSDFAAVVDAARGSFDDTFTQLLAGGPFASIAVDATAAAAADGRREIAATGALNTDLPALGPFTPYLTFGAGVVGGTGALPAAELSGRYRFAVLGEVPVDETDRVAIRFERPVTFAGVVGGGLRRELTERWALRLDVRALIGPDATRVRISAAPSVVRGAPAGFVESFTNPAIQFSNDPATGRRSSLSAPALQDVTVYSGGIQARTIVTFGVSRRF